MEGDYKNFNRFLAVVATLGMISLGFVVFTVAQHHGVTDWDVEKVKTALADSATKAKAELGKLLGQKPKSESKDSSSSPSQPSD